MSISNGAAAKNRNITPVKKRLMRDHQIFQGFTISAVFEIANEQILAHNENKPPNLKKVIDRTVDSVTLMGRTQQQTLAKCKEHL